MYPFGSLSSNLVAFCAVLRRDYGFHVGAGEAHDAARGLSAVDIADECVVRDVLRPILSHTFEDANVFDRAFTEFFFPGPSGVRQHGLPPLLPPRQRHEPPERRDELARRAERDLEQELAEAETGDVSPESGEPAAEEPGEPHSALRRASYSPLAGEAAENGPEVGRADEHWRAAARTLVRRVQLGMSRRWRPAPAGRRFDLRRTLRASLQTGGETAAPRWLRRPRRTPRFVLLLDGSRSMSAYASSALRLAVALATATSRLEVFTFSTSLRRVTREIRQAAEGTRHRLADLQHAWAGGTAIGPSLRDFLRRFGPRMLGRDTVVVVVSDGLDVGAPEVLRDAVFQLHQRSAGVVWLNPLIDTPGYEPTAGGMRAARPYVTTFASAADPAALARLSRTIRLRR